MKKIIFMIALVFSIASNAQNVTTNGTILLDDATSRTRVVVDAFLNSSNRVHELIEEIAPSGGGSSGDWQFVTNAYDTATNAYTIATNALTRQEAESGFTEWICEPATVFGETVLIVWEDEDNNWHPVAGEGYGSSKGDSGSTSLTWSADEWYGGVPLTATRVRLPTWSDITNITEQLSGKANTNDVQLTPVYSQTPTFSEWTVDPSDFGWIIDKEQGEWVFVEPDHTSHSTMSYDANATILTLTYDGVDYIATRVRTDIIGYTLGTQTNKVLAATNSLISASTITNLAPTRAEVEAGWWSEWTVLRDGVDVTAHVVQPKWDATVEGWYTFNACVAGDTNPTFGYAQSGQTSEDNDAILWKAWTDDLITEVPYTATRHRVAAPVPTKISDITNDVGYVTASNATNIAFAVSADATNSLSKSIAPTITNIASTVSSNAIANADTTYRRTIGLTNLNQSVQYVNITETAPSTLAISIPTDGATKDWMVYVVSVTNVTLSLPSETWWMADTTYTNDVPPATPTALWFSQVTDGIFILGRQELTEVTAP